MKCHAAPLPCPILRPTRIYLWAIPTHPKVGHPKVMSAPICEILSNNSIWKYIITSLVSYGTFFCHLPYASLR